MKIKFIFILTVVVVSSILLASIDIPHSTKYSNIIKIQDEELYIYFKKPKKNEYEDINVVILTDNMEEIKNLDIKVIFNKSITIEDPEKMKYETTLIQKEENEFSGKFRLLYSGVWNFKIVLNENGQISSFKDYFYYSKS